MICFSIYIECLHPLRSVTSRRARLRAAGLTGAALAISASFAPAAGAASRTVNLVAYSTPAAAYTALAKAFSASPAGHDITIAGSYGASGTQAKNVVAGQPADVVNFSLEPDMQTLVQAGIVSPKWDTVGPDHGNVTDSVVVFIVRPGNPQHIHNWSDLIKPGVQVVTPNPFSSGSARWNLAAAYGAQLKLGKTPAEADKYLTELLKNTVSQPTSASVALASFLAGTGNVLLDYEDDAIAAQNKGDADPIRDPAAGHLDPEPDRGHQERRRTRRPPRRSSTSCCPSGARSSGRSRGTGRSCPGPRRPSG